MSFVKKKKSQIANIIKSRHEPSRGLQRLHVAIMCNQITVHDPYGHCSMSGLKDPDDMGINELCKGNGEEGAFTLATQPRLGRGQQLSKCVEGMRPRWFGRIEHTVALSLQLSCS